MSDISYYSMSFINFYYFFLFISLFIHYFYYSFVHSHELFIKNYLYKPSTDVSRRNSFNLNRTSQIRLLLLVSDHEWNVNIYVVNDKRNDLPITSADQAS